MSDSDRAFLVLGSSGYGRSVVSYRWTEIPPDLNVADYNVVILDFASEFIDGTTTEDSDNKPTTQDFGYLLFRTDSTVYAIGNPNATFQSYVDIGSRRAVASMSVQYWLPSDLPAVDRSGEKLTLSESEWEFWFDHVAKYDWHLEGPGPIVNGRRAAESSSVVHGTHSLMGSWTPIATTRAGSPIGVKLSFSALSAHNQELATNNRVSWLPSLHDLTPRESILLLLSHVYGVTGTGSAPSWSIAYRLPREIAAIDAATAQERAVEEAQVELVAMQADVAEAARLRGLIYERDDALETLVHEAMSELGAAVTAPSQRGHEDGRLVDPLGREMMLEIKGNSGSLKIRDVRQLFDWKNRAFLEDGWSGKAVLVANLRLDLPPDERSDLVGPEALAQAERAGIAILVTTQLFEAVRLKEIGEFDPDAFWNHIFETNGLCKLPEPKPQPTADAADAATAEPAATA